MYQIQGHEPPFKRIRTDRPEIKDVELRRRRAQSDRRLKSIFESIFDKYEKDFEGVGDEIDLETGEIVVDNGHVSGLGYQRDVFGHDVGSDVDSESEESEEHRTLGSTIDVYNDDVIEDGCFTGITSSSPRNITPRVSALKKHPTPRLADASPLRLCYDSEDELYTGSTASYSLQPDPTVRHNPWLLQRSAITRHDRSISPTWATPELPRTAPRHFHRRLNTLPATRPHWEHSNGKTFTKRKTPVTSRPSPALTLGKPNNAPHSADAPSAERRRHGQRKTKSRPPSPCQSESDELGSPEFSQGNPARDTDRSRTGKRFADSRPVEPSLVPTPSDSSHEFDWKKTKPVEDGPSTVASPTSTRSLSIRSRSPPLDNSTSAKLVSQIHFERNDIQTNSFPPALESLPSTEQTYVRVRRPKRQRRRKWELFGARDISEDMQDAFIPNLPPKELSPPPPLKEHLYDSGSVVREIPDSDSTLSSQPHLEPGPGTPPSVPNAQASGQILSTNGVRSKKSSPDRERALQDDERPSPIMVQKHSAPPIFRNEVDHEVLQDLEFKSCSVKVVIPWRNEHANIPYRSFDKSFLHDEGKADALDTTARTQGLQEDPEPHEILASKMNWKPGRLGGKQIKEIPDSQPAREVVHNDCDTDVDLGPRIVPSFIVSDGVMERRSISNSPLMNPASSDSPTVPCTPTARSTPNTKGADEQQRHSLPSANTLKPQSATKSTLAELWDDSDDDLTLDLSSGKPARRSKPVKAGVLIRRSIPHMAACGDDELA